MWVKISVRDGRMITQANVSNEATVTLLEAAKLGLIQQMTKPPEAPPSGSPDDTLTTRSSIAPLIARAVA